ncbi:MAG: endo-1,4-beta-xylanase, partial [Planctomycetota bacterium]
GFVMIPVNWGQIEVERGCYDFSEVDACINALVKKRVSVGAGPLLCFSEEYLPGWLMKGRVGFEKIREAGYQFVSNVVERYSGSIRTWRVISGLNALNHFSFNFEQVLEMTRAATMAVKTTGDRATKIIEISDPWGEYYATGPQTIPPLVYMDMLIQSGINFDAFGFQMRFGRNELGMHVRDMMHISAMLEQAAPVGKPLYITELEVPSKMPDSPDSELAGVWHERWNESGQAKWLEQFYKTAFGKPFVDTVVYSHLADTEGSIISNSGLLSEKLESKESFHTLKRIRELIFSR